MEEKTRLIDKSVFYIVNSVTKKFIDIGIHGEPTEVSFENAPYFRSEIYGCNTKEFVEEQVEKMRKISDGNYKIVKANVVIEEPFID
ncbi:hypothetical protein [Flexibacterium corallicola]|uniref:hypothetical protein n=1 Tax=Flexibacterium corallicola TaxID=3037259 RepID=UPI00286F1AC2|nr:hypothetical protein [Pseudovibrio sp. M1P-2-3]